MPGIVGIISKFPLKKAESQLQTMMKSLHHEDSYVVGTWSDESLGFAAGWVALRGSFADSMPIHNKPHNIALIFSGEEFSDPDSVSAAQGGTDGKNGASHLVERLANDENFLQGLNGRFHGLLVDAGSGVLRLFNDRYGMHRIYYHEAKDAFYFAAEAKAILAVCPELRAVDPQGLAEFISCGCALENRTLFRGISVLPPASAWVFHNGVTPAKGTYFDPAEWENQSILDEENYYQRLREVFVSNLPRYFAGPQKIGISLTGGLDSRMIMSWRKAEDGSLPCYSFGGPYRDCQDVAIARKVARICGQSHETISVGNEFLAKFPHYSERAVYLTDGCLEVKHSPDLFVNERAAQIAPVRMTGNYGGEVLRRVRAFKPVDPVPGLFHSSLDAAIQGAKATYKKLLERHPLSFAVFCQAPWHHYGLLSLEQSQLVLRSPYLDNELVRTVFRAPQAALTSNDISLRLIRDGSSELRRLRTDRGLGGNLPHLLSSVRNQYLEFTFKAEYAYDYGMPQRLARVDHALSFLHLERAFLGRHKFYHFRVWYRDALASYIQAMLLDSRTLSRPWVNRAALESIVKGHVRGDRNYTSAIHKVLTLEHMHRLFIDAR